MILLFRTSLALCLALFLATACEERNEVGDETVDETGMIGDESAVVDDTAPAVDTDIAEEPDTYTMGEETGAVGDAEVTAGAAGTIDESQLNELQQLSYDEREQFVEQVRQVRDGFQQSSGELSSEAQQAMQQIDSVLDRLTNASAEEFEQLKSETLANLRTVHTEMQAH